MVRSHKLSLHGPFTLWAIRPACPRCTQHLLPRARLWNLARPRTSTGQGGEVAFPGGAWGMSPQKEEAARQSSHKPSHVCSPAGVFSPGQVLRAPSRSTPRPWSLTVSSVPCLPPKHTHAKNMTAFTLKQRHGFPLDVLALGMREWQGLMPHQCVLAAPPPPPQP